MPQPAELCHSGANRQNKVEGQEMPGPLEGVRVIDLTAVLLGPFATQHLADMGADVIKVEPPEGDLLRVSGGSMGHDKSMGPIYMAANRNKRSLCLDLKKPAACAALKELIKKADLFITFNLFCPPMRKTIYC